MLTINREIYRIPKYGNRPDENEDSVEVYQSHKRDLRNQEIRCAIADGATQTSFSSLWARLLVKEAIRYVPSEKRFWDITSNAQTTWAEEIAKINLPWHAEVKVKNGAFSTLLWLDIKRNYRSAYPGGTWKAIAIGDSNLALVRNNQLYFRFPIQASQDFGNSPVLLSSVQIHNSQITDYIRFVEWEWLPGDQFLVATDALSQYILKQFESSENPCIELAQLSKERDSHFAFENWVQSLRNEGEIRNDDTTLVKIQLEEQKLLIGN